LTAIAVATLVACGGGGGGGGFPVIPSAPAPAPAPSPPPAPPAPSPAPAPGPAPAPAPAAFAPIYELSPSTGSKQEFLSQVNEEGAKGFRFLSPLGFDGGANSQALFSKDADTTYTFVAKDLDLTAEVSDFQNELNEQGAQGYRWAGPLFLGDAGATVYRKDASATTYSYVVQSQGSAAADFLAQANNLGASGYYITGPGYAVGSDAVTVFEKASTGAAYAYELLEPAGNENDFWEQLNAQGKRGFRFRTTYAFSDGARVIYEKDTTQSSSFVFYGLDPQGTVSDFLSQANAEGKKGSAWIGDLVVPGGAARTLYVTPSACTGILCVSHGPFTG